MMAQTTKTLAPVRGNLAIAAVLAEVLGWLPSDQQIGHWRRRETDPLPVRRVFGRPQGTEAGLREWATRNL